jgi:hypothetical protein
VEGCKPVKKRGIGQAGDQHQCSTAFISSFSIMIDFSVMLWMYQINSYALTC